MRRGSGLPSVLTPFVGRSEGLAELVSLLTQDGVPLVTLSGPAGVGKTRLAIEAGRQLTESTGTRVRFVSFAEVRDHGLVGPKLLMALGASDAGAGEPMVRAAEVLGEAPGVLVLDNLEHLLEAAGSIVELIEACPGLTVLATSRHPLGLRVERVFPLAPLRLPSQGSTESEATAFLLARLEALDPTQDWAAEGQALVEIAQRLEGMPLALELAAARARVLTLEAIRRGLDRQLDLLGRGGVDVPQRQRTMRDALAWSCDLLSPGSTVVFRRLGVTHGSFCLPMVAALTGDLALTAEAVLDCLDDLVSHGLLTRLSNGRFDMLEVVREFAEEQVILSGEQTAACDTQARYMLEIAERAAEHLAGPEQAKALDALQEDAANFAASVRHALGRADAVLALRLCLSLRFLWYVRGPLAEGQAFFTAALSLPGGPPELRARAAVESAALARHRGELATARTLAEQGLTDARRLRDPELLAAALLQLGFVLHLMGDYDAAAPLLQESLTLREQAGDSLGTARVLHHLGLVALHGAGDADTAQQLQERALELFRGVGNSRHVATSLIALADLARRTTDRVRARELIAEALAHISALEDQPLRSYALYTAAAAAAAEGRTSAALRLLGAAESLARTCGAPPWPAVATSVETWLPSATARYGGPRVASLLRAGAHMSESDLRSLATGDEATADVPLTRRERQVADLVAEGLSNRAIAERLVISDRTVEGHVASIFSKLALDGRARLVAWVIENRALRS